MARFRLAGIEVSARPIHDDGPIDMIHGRAWANWGDWLVERDGGLVVVEVDGFLANAEPLDDEAWALLEGELVADDDAPAVPHRRAS